MFKHRSGERGGRKEGMGMRRALNWSQLKGTTFNIAPSSTAVPFHKSLSRGQGDAEFNEEVDGVYYIATEEEEENDGEDHLMKVRDFHGKGKRMSGCDCNTGPANLNLSLVP